MAVPLTCVVDYHGFRVLAVAKVPISTPMFTSSGKLRQAREELVHGTCDGGGTIVNENRALNSKLQAVAERLNLSFHTVKVSLLGMAQGIRSGCAMFFTAVSKGITGNGTHSDQ